MNRCIPYLVPLRDTLPRIAAALLLAGAALALGPLPASADLCDETEWSRTSFGDRGKTVRDYRSMREEAPQGVWRIDAGENGSVQLSDWERDEVLICAEVAAWSPDRVRAEKLLRSIHVETDGGRLRAAGPAQSKSARWAVSFRIFAPRSTDLDVEALNGGVSVEGIRGRMTLRTENGPLRIIGAGGDIRGRTSNGPLAVTLAGSRWDGRGLDVETTNGPVQLSIPRRYSAELTTGTENGPMAGHYVGASRRGRSRHVTTVLGSGGAPIRVVTTNGPVVVQHDGK